MKDKTKKLKNRILLILLLFKLYYVCAVEVHGERRKEENEGRENWENILECCMYGPKRSKVKDSRWCFREALPLALESLPPPTPPTLQIQISSLLRITKMLYWWHAWILTQLNYHFCKGSSEIKIILSNSSFLWLVKLSLGLIVKERAIFIVDFVIVGTHATSAWRDAETSEASWQRKEHMLGQAVIRELERNVN